MQFRDALTFDDVLLVPQASSILPADADTRTRLTKRIELGIPLLSAAMDTVTEAPLAIAMAQAGGIGVIHRNLDIERQAEEVRKVKRFESGMVVNPITIGPDASMAEALALMDRHGISGFPVVEQDGKLVGILTNRDVRFATNPTQPVRELMTKDRLVTVREGVGKDEAKRLLHQHRHREAAGGRRGLPLHRPDHGQGHRQGPAASERLQGRAGAAARRRRHRHRRQGHLARRGAVRRRRRRAGGGYRARPFRGRAEERRAGAPPVELDPDRRRQRRHRRCRQGADRRRGGRGQGRHRPGLDLHHPHGRRRRRAAADRGDGRASRSAARPASR